MAIDFKRLKETAVTEGLLLSDAEIDQARVAVQMRTRLNDGIRFGADNKFHEALKAIDEALRLSPMSSEAWMCRGLALEQIKQFDLACDAYAQAVIFTPLYAEAQERLDELAPPLGRPSAILTPWVGKPSPPLGAREFHKLKKKLGFREKWRFEIIEGSEEGLRRELLEAPTSVTRIFKLAQRIRKLGRYLEAAHFLRYALQMAPWHGESAALLCATLENGSDGDQVEGVALAALEAGATNEQLAPFAFWNNHKLCDWRNEAKWRREAYLAVLRRPDAAAAFNALHFADDPVMHQKCAASSADTGSLMLPRGWRPLERAFRRTPDRPITLGYLSADLRDHAVARLIAEVIELHDRSRFNVRGYSVFDGVESPFRRRIRGAFDCFVDLSGRQVGKAATRIADDEVDILIDLTGHTKSSPTSILLLKPAPIQVNYLGYPGTLGTSAVDYIIVDKAVVPSERQSWFNERLVHMPDCYQANDRKREVSEKMRDRTDHGFPADAVVFCAFNDPRKLMPDIFDVWMRILVRVPNSFLWLYSPDERITENLKRETTARGVDVERLKFAPFAPQAEHLARYHACDLFLDTPIYTGHTTASDALWNGCPLVTIAGNSFAARVGASILRAAGFPELVTTSYAEYEELAVSIGLDAGLRRDLRKRIEAARDTCALFDTPRFTRHLEWAYEHMWDEYVAGREPQSFEVPSLPRP